MKKRQKRCEAQSDSRKRAFFVNGRHGDELKRVIFAKDEQSDERKRVFFADEWNVDSRERAYFADGEKSAAKDRAVAPRVRRRRKNRIVEAAARLGRTKIFVAGGSGVRALSAVMKLYPVTSVASSQEGVSFFVPSKLLPKIVALLDNLCYDYKIIGSFGVAPKLLGAFSRVGIAVGVALSLLILSLYPCFVTRVSVASVTGESADGALNSQIQRILTSHGVVAGRWLPSLDADAISREILALDGVAYAGVERRGTHVSVVFRRELKTSQLWEIEGTQVVSTKLATVTRVIVEGGTAAVSYGDVVRPGDALIEGYVSLGEDRLPVQAKGRVYGSVLTSATVFYGDTALKKNYGAVKRLTRLGIFGKIPSTPKSPFEAYELRTERSSLGFLLPIEIYSYEFREISASEAEETRDDDELVLEVYSRLLADISEEAAVLNVYSSVTRSESGRTVKVTLQTEELISA